MKWIAVSHALVFIASAWAVAAHAEVTYSELPPTAHDKPQAAYPSSREGTAVGQVAGVLAVTDSSAGAESMIGYGFDVAVMGAHRSWPVMIGLGGGLLRFGESTRPGPFVNPIHDLVNYMGTTQVYRSAELRHAELLLRIQPLWSFVRPFVEGAFGFGVLWDVARLETSDGRELAGRQEQKSAAILYGGSVGADWRILPGSPHSSGTVDVVLTTAVRRWLTGPIDRIVYTNHSTGWTIQSAHESTGMWMPYLGITLTFDTRPDARAPEPPVLP